MSKDNSGDKKFICVHKMMDTNHHIDSINKVQAG